MKITQRDAAKLAWVTNNGMPGRYFLALASQPAVNPFAHMRGMGFDNQRAAQAIANGIRIYLTGSK
jgi:hypothetical protein